MSVSDPIIKDIKNCTLRFLEEVEQNGNITDSDPNLILFCEHIEKVFSVGLQLCHKAFGFTKQIDAWTWVEKLADLKDDYITFAFVSSVEVVSQHEHVLKNVGKFRLLLRYCLSYKCLHVPVEYLIKRQKLNTLFEKNCILGDEILAEIFLSVLRQCSKLNFKLDLKNFSFLDTTWILPKIIRLELVPCKSLGLCLSFAGDKAVVVEIKPNSVISENGKVEVGDVLDSLNGVHITGATKGKLGSIKSNKGQPVTLSLAKFKFNNADAPNTPYLPIVSLLKQLKMDTHTLLNKNNTNLPESINTKNHVSAGFRATYLGYVNTEGDGDIKQIDKATKMLLSPYAQKDTGPAHERTKKLIYFEVGEMGIKIVDCDMSDVILKHTYMEISSCGSVSQMPNYFAYIAGDENCDTATSFTCYIFHINNTDAAYTILQSIGQGFQRTHFAV